MNQDDANVHLNGCASFIIFWNKRGGKNAIEQNRFKQGKPATNRGIEQKATTRNQQNSMCLGCTHGFAPKRLTGVNSDDLTLRRHDVTI